MKVLYLFLILSSDKFLGHTLFHEMWACAGVIGQGDKSRSIVSVLPLLDEAM